MKFASSQSLSMGMELELQLLDPTTLNLTDKILPLMEFYPDNTNIKPEFIQNTVEIASDVFMSLADMETQMKQLVAQLLENCDKLGLQLCGGGTHPFGKRLATITPTKRFLQMGKVSGYLAKNQITFATHVHLGMRSANEAIRVMRLLKPFLPLLIALSANSPFWRGYETNFASYRQRILAASRSYGIPPSFNEWAEFVSFFNQTIKAGMFQSINDIHWDIRPRPKLGTIEVRVMDVQPTIAQNIQLARFIRALVSYLLDSSRDEKYNVLAPSERWWIEKDNYYQASKNALKSNFVYDHSGKICRLSDVFEEVLAAILPYSNTDNQTKLTDWADKMLSTGPAYLFQQAIFKQTGSLSMVSHCLTEKLLNEINTQESNVIIS